MSLVAISRINSSRMKSNNRIVSCHQNFTVMLGAVSKSSLGAVSKSSFQVR